MRKRFDFIFSRATAMQLGRLRKKYGTFTQVVVVAVDRLAREGNDESK